MHKDLRTELEATLLADCLVNNGFVFLGSVLKPMNFIAGQEIHFSRTDLQPVNLHRLVWNTMAEMYPAESIDPLTVAMAIRKSHGANLAYEIMCLCEQWGAVNRMQYAFMLLETDLRRAFCALISTFEDRHREEMTLLYDIQQVMTQAHNEMNDIFEVMYTVLRYFRSRTHFAAEAEEVQGFLKNISGRVREVKKQATIDTLAKNLEALYEVPVRNKQSVSCLLDLIKVCIVGPELPYDAQESIVNLRNNLIS